MCKKKMLCVVCSVVMAALLTGPAYGTIGDVWDFGDDFSGVSNPNGPWSYRSVTNALLLSGTEPFASGPAWISGGVFNAPWIIGDPLGGIFGSVAATDFVASGNARMQWTSPVAGTIDFSGTLFNTNAGVPAAWSLALNGVGFASGVSNGLAAAANEVPFSAQTVVGIGDVIDLDITDATAGGQYSLEQVPEPMTMSLLGLGALGVLLRRRKA